MSRNEQQRVELKGAKKRVYVCMISGSCVLLRAASCSWAGLGRGGRGDKSKTPSAALMATY